VNAVNISASILNCVYLSSQQVSKPHCSATFDELNSPQQVTCSVSYVGDLLPVFRCQPSAAQQPQQFINTSLVSRPLGMTHATNRIVTFVFVQVINGTRWLSGTPLTFTMEFTHTNLSDAEPPAYDFTWNYVFHTENTNKLCTLVSSTFITVLSLFDDFTCSLSVYSVNLCKIV